MKRRKPKVRAKAQAKPNKARRVRTSRRRHVAASRLKGLQLTAGWFDLPQAATRIERKLDQLLSLFTKERTRIMHNIDDVITSVAAQKTKIDGLAALTNGLRAQVQQILQSGNVPADVQTKIDAVFDGVEANTTEISAAIDQNTTQTPPAT